MTIIPTTEPIEIQLIDVSYGDSQTVIQISDETGTYDYAVLNGVSVEDLNMAYAKSWVEETYYCLSYRSTAYSAGYYSAHPGTEWNLNK